MNPTTPRGFRVGPSLLPFLLLASYAGTCGKIENGNHDTAPSDTVPETGDSDADSDSDTDTDTDTDTDSDTDSDADADTYNLSTADAVYLGEPSTYDACLSVSGAGDVNGDDLDDFLVGDGTNSAIGTWAGAAYLVLGRTNPVGGSLADADARFTGEETGDEAGWPVSGAGDVNGDGFDDILVGAGQNDAGVGSNAGAVYVVRGSAGLTSGSLADADTRLLGEGEVDWAGSSVSGAGDVNGDGLDDFLVGAWTHEAGGATGLAYLVLGSVSLTSGSLALADARLEGEDRNDNAGYSVSGAGDVNGDGLADFLVGAPGYEASTGAAYLLLGSASPASGSLAASDALYVGEHFGNHLGIGGDDAGVSVSGAGDVNGDGLDDFLVGAEGYNSAGAAFLVLGSVHPAGGSLADLYARFTGEEDDNLAGVSVSGAGDVDGDGLADLLVGAEGCSLFGRMSGAAYLVLGSVSPVGGSLADADARFTGENAGDMAGESVSGAGDVNGDSIGDILVGAAYEAGDPPGAAYLVVGRTF